MKKLFAAILFPTFLAGTVLFYEPDDKKASQAMSKTTPTKTADIHKAEEKSKKLESATPKSGANVKDTTKNKSKM